MKKNSVSFAVMLLFFAMMVCSSTIAYSESHTFDIVDNEGEKVLWLDMDNPYSKIWFYENVEMYMISYPDGGDFTSFITGLQLPVGTQVTLKSELEKASSNMDVSFSVKKSSSTQSNLTHEYDFTLEAYVEIPIYDENGQLSAENDARYTMNPTGIDETSVVFNEEGYYMLNFTVTSSSKTPGIDIGSVGWYTIFLSVGDNFETDVPSDWAEESLVNVVQNYGSFGVEDTFFSDFGKEITRLEFVNLALSLYSNIGGPYQDVEYEAFSDCSDYNVQKAKAYGLINGYEDGTFRPENKMTRAEIATLLMRVLDRAQMTYERTNVNRFVDLEESHWSYQSILDAQVNGFVSGVSEDHFDPSGTATKEQVLVIIQRIIDIHQTRLFDN